MLHNGVSACAFSEGDGRPQLFTNLDFLDSNVLGPWGSCERRRVIPYPTTWAAPKRWWACTKDRIWTHLKSPTLSPQRLSSVALHQAHDAPLHQQHSLRTAPRRRRIGQLDASTAAGRTCQTSPLRSGVDRGLATHSTCFYFWSTSCLMWELLCTYRCVREGAVSHHAELLSALGGAMGKPCLYNL